MVVLPSGDAIVDEQRKEGCGHVFGVDPLDGAVAFNFDVDKMVDLLAEGFEELIVAPEARRVSGLEADFLSRPRVETVMEGDF
jgi:hypothetical protein